MTKLTPVFWAEMLKLEAPALSGFLEQALSGDKHRLADQLRCLSCHLKPGSAQAGVVAEFCVTHLEDFAAEDRFDVIRAGASLLPLTDKEGQAKLAAPFRALLDTQTDMRRACDMAALARSTTEKGGGVYFEAGDYLLAHSAGGEAATLLRNIAEDAAAMDPERQDRFLDRALYAAKDQPYDTAQALRVFLEQTERQDTAQARRALSMLKTLSDSPGLALEILDRDYGLRAEIVKPAAAPYILPPTKIVH